MLMVLRSLMFQYNSWVKKMLMVEEDGEEKKKKKLRKPHLGLSLSIIYKILRASPQAISPLELGQRIRTERVLGLSK